MKYLVTGAAGFIGSHIAQRLLDRGDEVIGIDCFLDYYPRALKEYRLKFLLKYNKLEFIEGNLLKADLSKILKDVDFVIHEAAQPGVRTGWNSDFEGYSRNNIEVTQRLLNMSRDTGIKKFIFASSSSVYGNAEEMPTTENAPTKPLSPYGVTKLACEHLCNVYYKSFGVPVVILRHFTVFGPKPRPDMAHTIFSRAILTGREIQIYGDGEQSRGFTYVSDIVDATLSATEKDIKGEIFKIGGGVTATVKEIIEILEKIIGKKAITRHVPALKGEARHTYPDISKAAEMLDYHPKVSLEEGLIEVVKSVKDFYGI